jgi:hypothetical protein
VLIRKVCAYLQSPPNLFDLAFKIYKIKKIQRFGSVQT